MPVAIMVKTKALGIVSLGFAVSPANSIMFLGGVAMALGLSGSFVFLATATSLTRLIVYVVCIAALPVIKGRADPVAIERAYRINGIV